MKLLAGSVLLALMVAAADRGQTPAQTPPRDVPRLAVVGSAVISGSVVADDETRAPLRRAAVYLSRTGTEDLRVTATDDQGRFRFMALPAGAYTIRVSKGAYISMSYGAPKPGMPGRTITLADGQQVSTTPVALMRGAVIGGRVLNRDGRPAQRSQVTVAQVVSSGGALRRRASAGSTGTAWTDEHGEYRIFGLLPGDYVVYASPSLNASLSDTTAAEVQWASQPVTTPPPAARPFGSAPTMFPGTTDDRAGVPVAVTKGQERLDIDFPLQFVALSRVAGVVTNSSGQPAARATVLRMTKQPNPLMETLSLSLSLGSDGAFAFPEGVAPGEWTILARGQTVAGVATWGVAEITAAGRDLSDIVIQLAPGVPVSGRAEPHATPPAPSLDLTRVQVRLQPADPQTTAFGGSASAMLGADGTFVMTSVVPGLWKLTATVGGSTATAGPWFVRSAMLDGRDLLDVPVAVRPGSGLSGIVLTLADDRTELSGTLTDAAGAPASQVYVSVFSTDQTTWTQGSRRIASVRASDTGQYSLAGLPAGEYYLCALTELDTTLQFEPDYLEQLIPAAIKVTLTDGEKKQQNLRIGG